MISFRSLAEFKKDFSSFYDVGFKKVEEFVKFYEASDEESELANYVT